MSFANALGNNALPISGGTLGGDLFLAADPVSSLQAATKQYVDANVTQGNIVQVIFGSSSTRVSNATTSYVSTGVSATITPTDASHHIIVLGSLNFSCGGTTTLFGIGLQLFKAGSLLLDFGNGVESIAGNTLNFGLYTARTAPLYYDVSGSTSAITYEYFFASTNTHTAFINHDNSISTLILAEVSL